jgi:membrane protease YdiL (CAAX protease family)
MARNVWHRWWRPIVGTLLVCAAGLAAIIAAGIIGYLAYAVGHNGRLPIARDGQIFPNATAELAFELSTLAILTPVALLGAWAVQRRRPGTLSSVRGKLRWRWLGVCCLLSIGFLIVSYGWGLAVEAMFSGQRVDLLPPWKGWDQFIAPAVVIVLLVPFQATAEEYLFRGWLIQAIGSWAPDGWMRTIWGRWLSVWPALAVSAVVFMLGHGYTGWARLDVFLFGLLAGWLAVRTGGLEAGIALHTFNNLYAFLIPAAGGQLVDAMNQGGSPWWALLSDLVPLALYAGVVLLVARRRRLESRSA